MKRLALAVALALAVSVVPSKASATSPLVNCISGCPDGKLKADSQISDQWWLGPSVGLALAARDNATGAWETNLAFQFQYGLKWRPSWWTATPSFLSFDLGFQAGTNPTAPDFQITLAPTVNLLDIIAIGYGPRFRFTDGTHVSGVLFLGLATSFGGP